MNSTMPTRGKPSPAPWLVDGEPERWLPVGKFARLVNRSRSTVYVWLLRGDVLREFGYKAYRDPHGKWFIQVPRCDADLIR